MNAPRLVAALTTLLLLASCKTDSTNAKPADQAAAAPADPGLGLPTPLDSAENPTTPEKAQLGYTLFFDKRLSKDGSMACAGCHFTDHGWATPNAVDTKVGGAANKRNTPTLLNVGLQPHFYWDGRAPTAEAVSLAAWKAQLGADPAAVAPAIAAVPAYKERFQAVFKEDPSADNIPKALGAFLRSLKAGNSGWDRFMAGDKTAMSEPAQRGWKLFQENACIVCHVPPAFTNFQFHNVGIGSDKPEDQQDKGRMDHTKDAADKGKFKTPSLRNVALTAPYFHDGSAATLDQAINVMVGGGIANPGLDQALTGHKLTDAQKADLKAFLEALTGTPAFNAPAADVPH
ncbi:MAG: cytochrome-c peroxidase [Deltaproteobacteria bacterium]|nr:cytochrome-c peroxidase [Deltaproteobacteria bacterium]